MTAPDKQVLVYQMQYSATEPTAMILPLPVSAPADDKSVDWKNLKEDQNFFTQLHAGFPEVEKFSLSRSKSAAALVTVDTELAVHEVGDFIASFVPTVDDFSRVDPRFAIKKDIWSKIPEYKDYGFAVFQLKELAGSPHPIAFEFKTRLADTVYFPTVHIHDGTVHAEDSFDHALFLQDSRFDSRVSAYDGPTAVDRETGFVRSKTVASSFSDVPRSLGLVDGTLLVHRRRMNGMLPNRDTLVNLAANASGAKAGGCGRCDVGAIASEPRITSLGPAGFALAGLAWVIRRRNERRERG